MPVLFCPDCLLSNPVFYSARSVRGAGSRAITRLAGLFPAIFPLVLFNFACIFGCLFFTPAAFADSDRLPGSQHAGIERVVGYSDYSRPTVGLVLSGGGARGLAHIGVLRVLEEMHIPVDIVVGTSAGSGVGALYALGLPVSEIEERFHQMNWSQGFQDQIDRSMLSMRKKQETRQHSVDATLGINENGVVFKNALVQGQQLGLILNHLTRESFQIDDFDQLPRRYRAVAADLATGEEVVIGSGSMARAVRASMSIPGVFPPVKWQDKLLVDGGVANNLPISVARDLGADIIIAVDISQPLVEQEKLVDILAIADQMSNFLTRKNVEIQLATLKPQDVLIVPNLDDFASSDFHKSDEIVEIGATATRDRALDLQPLVLPDNRWNAYLADIKRVKPINWVIDRIEVSNTSFFSDRFVLSRIRQKTGEPFDRNQLEHDINTIYGLGHFESVSYALKIVDGKRVMVISVFEKSWGPSYLLFDFAYEEDFDIDRRIRLGASISFTELNALGAEWRTFLAIGSQPEISSRFFQPLSQTDSSYLQVEATAKKTRFNYFEGGNVVSEAEFESLSFIGKIGNELGNWGDVSLGILLESVDMTGRVGVGVGENVEVQLAGYRAGFTFDTLDDARIPASGSYFDLEFDQYLGKLGSDRRYSLVAVDGFVAGQHGKWIWHASTSLFKVTSGKATVDKLGKLGGVDNLSAYPRDRFVGQDSAYGSFSVYREFDDSWQNYFAGVKFEAGRVWEPLISTDDVGIGWHSSYSLVFGIPTVLGAIKLTASYGDEGEGAAYLTIGRTYN
ncbi:MAG: patatin [Proteobacteria bacterium]|nr:MAG: patatin [Pseudomonadota bacterium]PIE40072.1 MAG: patatin [Gammaproteobacteria bacterium]